MGEGEGREETAPIPKMSWRPGRDTPGRIGETRKNLASTLTTDSRSVALVARVSPPSKKVLGQHELRSRWTRYF